MNVKLSTAAFSLLGLLIATSATALSQSDRDGNSGRYRPDRDARFVRAHPDAWVNADWRFDDVDVIHWQGRTFIYGGGEAPFRSHGELYLPLRPTAHFIGARVSRTLDGLRIWVDWGGNEVQYDKGHKEFRINGYMRDMAHGSRDVNGVMYLPVQVFQALTGQRIR